MKLINSVITVLFLSFMVSCSSDDGESLEGEYFNYKLDGEALAMTSWEAGRSEQTLVVKGIAENGMVIEILFNQFGDLGVVNSYDMESFDFDKRNHYHFKSHYFNFELVSLTDNMVKIEFSGKVYEDEEDLNSDFSEIEGSVNIHYTTVAPLIPGLNISADINGQAWHETESYRTGISDQIRHCFSDDEYKIMLAFDGDFQTGIYNFDNSSQYNKVMLAKYDIATQSYIEYESSAGIFTLSSFEQNPISGVILVSGTFTLNAVNPNDSSTIEVTNGQFKTTLLP